MSPEAVRAETLRADAPPLRAALDDAELVRRAQAGDEAAFAALHERYRRVVASVVRSETRNGADVADIVQDTFVLAWTRLGSLRDPERFRAWLLQITRHAVIDHSRTVRRRPALDSDDDLTLDLTVSDDPGPDDLVELAELASRVQGALDGLSRRDVVAVTLAAQFGFGPAEIGEALHITPNNAKVVLHRARRRLRSMVE
ncbi:MAG TPA: sigma-70 family RNA polymerase sigma factor [Acidimicrobiales bacterium]|nr:sigma-70 family RNA polymerase sigma factor [Acidimicrobiales bacterium]